MWTLSQLCTTKAQSAGAPCPCSARCNESLSSFGKKPNKQIKPPVFAVAWEKKDLRMMMTMMMTWMTALEANAESKWNLVKPPTPIIYWWEATTRLALSARATWAPVTTSWSTPARWRSGSDVPPSQEGSALQVSSVWPKVHRSGLEQESWWTHLLRNWFKQIPLTGTFCFHYKSSL